ncbi:MAG: hypothetical protein ACRDWD_13660 [Acidimicrobiia bacterium]
MADNPDPTLELTSSKGTTRTLDDWSTMFPLCLVMLPPRPEAEAWVPVAERVFRTFRDADCHTVLYVAGPALVAQRILGPAEDRYLTFADPDATLAKALGLGHLPAFVFLRQDTTVAAAAEGWDPAAWQKVVETTARALAWTEPQITGSGDPAATPGWPV